IDSINLSSLVPTTNQTLTATVAASDLENDPLTYTYVWKVNTTIVKTTSSTSSNTDSLDLSLGGTPGNGNAGDLITVQVTANDGTVNGIAVTSGTATVQNSAPVAQAAN